MKAITLIKKITLSILLINLLTSTNLLAQNLPPVEFVFSDSVASKGYYFMIPYTLAPPFTYDHPHMIFDRLGKPVYYRTFLGGSAPTTTADFKLQPNGQMSFFSPVLGRFYLMDSTFTVVDSIEAVGYDTDTHELQLLDNGHWLILGRETRTLNLTQYHWFGSNHTLPGSPNAEVTGAVVQELDENKNLIWQWKAHDYFEFDDVDSVWLNNPTSVDWTHSNAIELDTDGNILLSSRHLNEITKINHATGAIMWRMGGKNNQFVFTNDAIGWTGQHDIRRLNNGHVTLWDNGQYTNPPLGRALELSLNETAKIATVEWEYIQDSAMFSLAMGNHQQLDDNNRLINYGFVGPAFPMCTVVKPNKDKVVEIYGPDNYANYRAFNYASLPWELKRPTIDCQLIDNDYYLIAEPGHESYLWSTGATTQSIALTQTGEYNVFVPYGGGNISSDYIKVTDITNPCNYVGITTQINQSLDFTCNPNPAKEFVTISFNSTTTSSLTIAVYDLMGRKIMLVFEGKTSLGINTHQIPVHNLMPGVYMLAKTQNGLTSTKKLIVNQ